MALGSAVAVAVGRGVALERGVALGGAVAVGRGVALGGAVGGSGIVTPRGGILTCGVTIGLDMARLTGAGRAAVSLGAGREPGVAVGAP